MKLYATTTSERASKGQGGEYLDITITTGKEKRKLWTLTVRESSSQFTLTAWNDVDNKYQLSEISKGEKQKGEKLTDGDIYKSIL
jgi:hypothetical protein